MRFRKKTGGGSEVYVQLLPGQTLILRTFAEQAVSGPGWTWWQEAGQPSPVTGTWHIQFIQGGPALPLELETTRLASWTDLGGDETKRFAGTARYRITFDAPTEAAANWLLDLGQVCQSARVRLNGRDLGVLLTSPFRVPTGSLKPTDNLLEVEVTNVSANRIRDLDRRHANWKNFHDINIVNINYRPFDASNWPLTDSGLLGPVRLIPVEPWQFTN